MMRKWIPLLILAALAYNSSAQEQVPPVVASMDSIKKSLYFLASDKLEGRETGKRGQKEAAEYISSNFRRWGLKPIQEKSDKAYYQEFCFVNFPLRYINETHIELRIEGIKKELKFPSDDFIILSGKGFGNTSIIPYAGNEEKAANTTNHAPVIFCKTIDEGLAIVDKRSKVQQNKYTMLVLPTNVMKKFSEDRFQVSVSTAIFSTSETPVLPEGLYGDSYYINKVLPFLKSHPDQNIILVDRPFLKKIFTAPLTEKVAQSANRTIGKKITMKSIYLPDTARLTKSENVVGIIEGTSKKNEAIVVCAHYDHLGIRPRKKTEANSKPDSLFNGADDNASGTSAVLEIARLLTQAKEKGYKPQRTIIIVAFSAEEKGLVGSRHMVKHPIHPLNETKMIVNLDMVGRTDERNSDSNMYVYPITLGTDSAITAILDQSSKKAGIDIYQEISPREKTMWTYGSDHNFFVKKGIPAISLTTGMHPDYHTPADEVDKINFRQLTHIANFAFYTIWQLANR